MSIGGSRGRCEHNTPLGQFCRWCNSFTEILKGQNQMTAELEALLKQAAKRPMTVEEIFEQRVSWVWGQLPHDDPRTIDQVRDALTTLNAPDGR